MLGKNVLNLGKVWFRFEKMGSNGKILKFRWEKLPEHRFEEFIDFKMNYYVPHEFSHSVAGISKNPEAIKEYRQIILKKYRDPSYHNSICCLDNDTGDIVAFDSLRMFRQGVIYENLVEAQTAEVKFYHNIEHMCDELCSVQDIMVKYGSTCLFEDGGCAIHPDYKGYGITFTLLKTREAVCKTNAVPLTGAWVTSVTIQKATTHGGWDVYYELDCGTVEKILGRKLENAPPTIQYKVKTYDLNKTLTLVD